MCQVYFLQYRPQQLDAVNCQLQEKKIDSVTCTPKRLETNMNGLLQKNYDMKEEGKKKKKIYCPRSKNL